MGWEVMVAGVTRNASGVLSKVQVVLVISLEILISVSLTQFIFLAGYMCGHVGYIQSRP